MTDPQKSWLRRLGKLHPNVDRRKGDGPERFAPHKPLLLLALIDAIEAGEVNAPTLGLSAALRLRFNAFWPIVVTRWTTRPDARLPFHHLSSQGFWRALREDGKPSSVPETTRTIEVHPEFFHLLQEPRFRQLARRALVETWFPPLERVALCETLGLKDEEEPTEMLEEEAAELAQSVGRDARFRIQVVSQYQYACALTGHTLTVASSGATMVQAAHIAAFADTRSNDPRNGLALTPDAHWSFDEGLWTIEDDLRVIVATRAFEEWAPSGDGLKRYHGQPLYFAPRTHLRPDPHYLRWHRERRFVG